MLQKVRQNSTTRRVLSGMLLLLFFFSATPKIFLHDLVARHKDTPVVEGKIPLISKGGFHCDVDSLVVALPYIYQVEAISFPASRTFQVYTSGDIKQAFSSLKYVSGLRGPPSSI